jgi:hypothetical protein
LKLSSTNALIETFGRVGLFIPCHYKHPYNSKQ